jgi:protein involved in polysaccharide export with SLBB domain
MKRIFLISSIFFFIFFLQINVIAQINPSNIENLTDQQVMQLVNQYDLAGLSETDFNQRAKEMGLGVDQIQLLQKRIALINMNDIAMSNGNAPTLKTDVYNKRAALPSKVPEKQKIYNQNELQIFGSNIFDNLQLSFQPNLQIATPANYLIGTNDELIIDVYGISDLTKKLLVNTEGNIRFPKYGPIKVAGLSIEQATNKVKRELTNLYPGLKNGTTSIKLSLGQMRSIQVTLLGEVVTPGTYTIPSLSTIMNALYTSGGPTTIGSFRQIELVRSGKVISNFDIYDFLLKGDLTKNTLLQDQDIIKVAPYFKRVTVIGAIKKPAIFDLKPTENLQDVIAYAGSYADNSMKDFVRIKRMGNSQMEIVTVFSKDNSNTKLVSGDVIFVDSLAKTYQNRVNISGAINYPGDYGIDQINNLHDLLNLVSVKQNAYLNRAYIKRRDAQLNPVFINFNVSEALKSSPSIALNKEDSIVIFENNQLHETYTVKINGQVNQPGSYMFSKNMTVRDLILMASGYKDGATLDKIEIARRLRETSSGIDTSALASIKVIDLSNKEQSNLDYILEPFDIVEVRQSSVYKEQISVKVEGEVMYPGTYILSSNNEKLSDLIVRAGGLKKTAFVEGAVLYRNTYSNKSIVDKNMFASKLKIIQTETIANSASNKQSDSSTVKSLLVDQKPVGLKLADALKNPASLEDIRLEESDVLSIPKLLETVQSFGAVRVPKQLIYEPGMGVSKAIFMSGGFTETAYKKGTYVVYSNGDVKKTHKFFFIRIYPKLKRGAEIYVPSKGIKVKMTTNEVLGLGGTILSMSGLLLALVRTL